MEAKRKVEEAKKMSNFKWGQGFDRSYEDHEELNERYSNM